MNNLEKIINIPLKITNLKRLELEGYHLKDYLIEQINQKREKYNIQQNNMYKIKREINNLISLMDKKHKKHTNYIIGAETKLNEKSIKKLELLCGKEINLFFDKTIVMLSDNNFKILYCYGNTIKENLEQLDSLYSILSKTDYLSNNDSINKNKKEIINYFDSQLEIIKNLASYSKVKL